MRSDEFRERNLAVENCLRGCIARDLSCGRLWTSAARAARQGFARALTLGIALGGVTFGYLAGAILIGAG